MLTFIVQDQLFLFRIGLSLFPCFLGSLTNSLFSSVTHILHFIRKSALSAIQQVYRRNALFLHSPFCLVLKSILKILHSIL